MRELVWMQYGRERAEWDRLAALICNTAAIHGKKVAFEAVHLHYQEQVAGHISMGDYVKQQKAKRRKE